jgi:hypothetical protein
MALFGAFEFRPDPQPQNPEHIRILGDWVKTNITAITLPVPKVVRADGTVEIDFNIRAVEQLRRLWADWAERGLLDRILTYDGAFVPRFQRGSTTTLSNHSWGTAFDINAEFNPRGSDPAEAGQKGCVYDLVALANKHGFFWGGHFQKRKDGMHFEVADLQP